MSYLRELAIFADEGIVERYKGGFVTRFHRETCCVTELYAYLIRRKLRTPGTVKVLVKFTDIISTPPDPCDDHVSHLGQPFDVLALDQWPFNFAAYLTADESGKKKLICDELHRVLMWFAEIQGWDKQVLADVYSEATRLNYLLEGITKKSWRNSTRHFNVRIAFRYLLSEIELYGVLFRNRSKREVGRRLLGKAIPSDDWAWAYLSEGQWVTPDRFELRDQSFCKRVWSCDFGDLMCNTV